MRTISFEVSWSPQHFKTMNSTTCFRLCVIVYKLKKYVPYVVHTLFNNRVKDFVSISQIRYIETLILVKAYPLKLTQTTQNCT